MRIATKRFPLVTKKIKVEPLKMLNYQKGSTNKRLQWNNEG